MFIATVTTHEELLIAIVGGLGLILVAVVGLWKAQRTGRESSDKKMDAMRDHLPPNGSRLYEMVEATKADMTDIKTQLNKVEVAVMDHLTWAERFADRVERHMDEGGKDG